MLRQNNLCSGLLGDATSWSSSPRSSLHVGYFGSNDHSGIPRGGIGQGNGAGPAIWALVSTPIFNALRKRGYGVFLPCPLSSRLLHFAGYAFVDDTDLSVTDQQTQIPRVADITTTMQASVTLWEGFIRASGGALRPEKATGTLLTLNGTKGTGLTSNLHPQTPFSPSEHIWVNKNTSNDYSQTRHVVR